MCGKGVRATHPPTQAFKPILPSRPEKSFDEDTISRDEACLPTLIPGAPWKGAFSGWVRNPPNNCRFGW